MFYSFITTFLLNVCVFSFIMVRFNTNISHMVLHSAALHKHYVSLGCVIQTLVYRYQHPDRDNPTDNLFRDRPKLWFRLTICHRPPP